MKNLFNKILSGFDYTSFSDFLYSLLPAFKYNLITIVFSMSFVSACIDKVFGLTALALIFLIIVFVAELTSGIYAAHINKENIESRKLSRFTFKVACYLLLIAVPYVFYDSYKAHGNMLVAQLFSWLHDFLIIHIVIENVISILENAAVIRGKPKAYYINKIKEKFHITLIQ